MKPRFVIRNEKRVPATCTKQFVVGDIGFFKDGEVIPRTSPLDVLLTADLSFMKISNQFLLDGSNHHTTRHRYNLVRSHGVGAHFP